MATPPRSTEGGDYSGKDRPIYLRIGLIGGSDDTRSTFWYVIEEKQSSLSFLNEVAGCKSEKDTVRRLPLIPENGSSTNNVAVINSRVYLIGGESYTRLHAPLDDGSLGYYHLDLNLDSGVEEWHIGGGKQAEHQCRGGVALGHDGSLYSVGPNNYQLRPGAYSWEKLPTPPQGPNPRHHNLRWTSFLGITTDKLYVYSLGGGGRCNKTSAMLSFDFLTEKWEFLDEFLYGEWSPGVVLCDDRYLVSFGTRSPKLSSEEEKLLEARRKSPVEVWEEDVPGLYVFDLQKRQWLPEPVQDLPNDGTVIPEPHRRLVEELDDVSFSPQLFQIREDDDHYLALLWDSFGESCNCEITWCKFMLDVCTTTDDDIPRFSAHSLSRGFCSFDEGTSDMFNCVVGMDVSIGI